jgi:hypothetical protein
MGIVSIILKINEILFPPLLFSLCIFIHWHARTLFFSFNRSLVRMRELRYRPYLAECRTFFSCQTILYNS